MKSKLPVEQDPDVFVFRSADRAEILMSLSKDKQFLWINATVPYNHYLMLYFLGYSGGESTAVSPKLFGERIEDPKSPNYQKGSTHCLVWQSDRDWSLCGEAIHIEGAETPVMYRDSKVDCTIVRDDA